MSSTYCKPLKSYTNLMHLIAASSNCPERWILHCAYSTVVFLKTKLLKHKKTSQCKNKKLQKIILGNRKQHKSNQQNKRPQKRQECRHWKMKKKKKEKETAMNQTGKNAENNRTPCTIKIMNWRNDWNIRKAAQWMCQARKMMEKAREKAQKQKNGKVVAMETST